MTHVCSAFPLREGPCTSTAATLRLPIPLSPPMAGTVIPTLSATFWEELFLWRPGAFSSAIVPSQTTQLRTVATSTTCPVLSRCRTLSSQVVRMERSPMEEGIFSRMQSPPDSHRSRTMADLLKPTPQPLFPSPRHDGRRYSNCGRGL